MKKSNNKYNSYGDAVMMDAGTHVEGTLNDRIKKKVDRYEWPVDPLIKERLDWFLDQKLGLMIHWGVYCQLGIKESHPLIDDSIWKGDPDWMRWQLPKSKDIREFKEEYSNLHKTFNPVRFDPDEWAEFAQNTGFKYLLFTTKHHDGFCMWDTLTTDYRITGPDCSFRDNRNADITGRLYDAFRSRKMAISVYFSKPDWHCPLYWEPGYLLNQRTHVNPSYDIKEYPELWERFISFMHDQIIELTTKYGRIECLWFDGGIPGTKINQIVDSVRKNQPWVLSADRSQGGQYENFITPELEIPETVLPVPWETCLCLGKKMEGEPYISFGYTYDQDYYTSSETLHIFLDIVARGGNLALNIGPQPDGRLPVRAMRSLINFGRWMKIFSRGIYGTRPCPPYFEESFRYTKKQNHIYVFKLYEDSEPVPPKITFRINEKILSVSYMRTDQSLEFVQKGNFITVKIPIGMIGAAGFMADGLDLSV